MKNKMLALALALSAVCAVPAQAVEARVNGSMLDVSYWVGLRLGQGSLKVDGQDMKFNVRGLSLLSMGVAGGNFKGKVKNLKNIADFEGRYTFAEAGGAYGVGGSVQKWVNSKGVTLELTGLEIGLEARLGPGALNVSFAQ